MEQHQHDNTWDKFRKPSKRVRSMEEKNNKIKENVEIRL
jgi:hypothetical protein